MQLIQLLLYAIVVNYVKVNGNIHSFNIPQGHYYTHTAKINGCNGDT
jgi:hypothetical protein